MGANEAQLLEALLARPEWLHNKLRAYGVASLVSDFRRCEMRSLLRSFHLVTTTEPHSVEE